MGIGCAPAKENGDNNSYIKPFPSDINNSLALPQQKAPPRDIQSIQLHPKGNPSGAPILQLNSQEKLVLSFDYLGEESRQFRLQISHRTQNWEKSSITPSTYLDSFSRSYIQSAKESFSQHTSYWHVEHEFPGKLRPVVSGNYLMEIYSYNSGELLFSIPFFITENKGSLNTRIERLYSKRDDGRPIDQPFGTFRYPDFVEYPQFDLSMSFVQNRFWGRMKKAGFLDTIDPGQLHGHLRRKHAYIGNYEFKILNLKNLSPNGQEIIEYNPSQTPPAILLRRDSQNLDISTQNRSASFYGNPLDTRNSEYARVKFSLETNSSITPASDIYIVGHFNNWMINSFNKMRYDNKERLWKGEALIKQGQYAYKYVLIRSNRVDDLSLDQSFLSTQQEYLTFIYFKDPDKNFDRILKIKRTVQQ
ncbi:type IX secretion system plug protein domain-containing protein [Fodinibius saliphilus]|uniref:type IX secretion system plug protein n=1 Tax=Fodinibius saliphilus TaxID=1920650 RepID=UPI001486BA26|nr:type IX secretion system plug protein domain-containing protein [Fodinibius saliphilus]